MIEGDSLVPVPRVSVLMPVFNGERFLKAAMDSVLAQTMPNFELVVVDDGSTDGSADLVRGYDDDRVVLLQPGHQGVAGALNAGLNSCRAELVARLDADDLMEPNRLERQCAFLDAWPELGGAASYLWIIDQEGRTTGTVDTSLLTPDDVEKHLETGGRLVYPHPTIMYRRSVVLGLGGYDRAYEAAEDVELFVRMYEAGRPLIVQPERLTRVRYHAGSVSATSARRQFLLDDLIHSNYARRRAGQPPRTLEQHVAWLHRSLPSRLITGARMRSALSHKRSHQERVAGRHLRANALLGLAAVLEPGKVLRRVRRRLTG